MVEEPPSQLGKDLGLHTGETDVTICYPKASGTHQGIGDSPRGELDTTITLDLEQKASDLCCPIQ